MLYLKDGISTSTVPPDTTQIGLLCRDGRSGAGEGHHQVIYQPPFALTYKLLWEISDPNIATIKSKLTSENKQEYHTR